MKGRRDEYWNIPSWIVCIFQVSGGGGELDVIRDHVNNYIKLKHRPIVSYI